MGKLQVGAAKVCINPTPDMMPFPNGNGEKDRYEGIFSNCYTRACVIDNGKTQTAFLGFDLGGPPAGEVLKPMIEAETGIPADQIMLSAIHNHTGCGIFMSQDPADLQKGKAYEEMVLSAAVEAVKQAKAALRPAKYGYGEGKSYINMNRDCLLEDGTYTQAPDPTAYSDKTLSVLKFVDEAGKLICAIVNYGMHATIGFLDVDVDGKAKCSGNIPGIAEEYVEARYGNDAVVIWNSAAAGDQNPAMFCLRDYEADGFPKMAKLLPGAQYQLMVLIGKQHGVDICKAIQATACGSENMPIRFVETRIDLPGQKPAAGEDMGKAGLYANRIVRIPEGESLPKMEDDPEHPFSLYLQQAIFGDIALIGLAAEIYSRLGRDCKELSPYKKTMVVTHVNKARGYVVDRYSVDHQCFQSFGPIKPGSADTLILNEIQQQFDQLLEE